MTVHDLHDALTLLPSDLITAADRVRSSPKTNVVPWKRFLPMAACLVLLFGLGMMVRGDLLNHVVMQKNTAAEAPAVAAPMAPLPESQEIAADEAIPEEPAAEAPETGNASNSAAMGDDKKAAQEELCIDHSHRFAEEEQTVEDPVKGYCGNMTAAIDVAGERFEISGSDAVAITKILINLDYDPDQVCRCMTDITVDTETLTDIRINLGEAFARCEKGQAALTEEQVQVIRQIIEKLS